LNKIDFRDLVKPINNTVSQDIDFLYFTHRYEAGKKIETLVSKKNIINKASAFTFIANKFSKGSVNLEKNSPNKNGKDLKESTVVNDGNLISSTKLNASNRIKGRL